MMRRLRSRAWRFLTYNRRMKVLAALLACIVWYAVRQTLSYEAVISDVPLTIEADEGWAVLERSTDSVDVRVRGSQEDILKLNRDYLSVVVDVRGRALAGAAVVPLDPSQVRVPGGVRAVQVLPNTVEMSLDREGEKQVPLKADIQGTPPDGYEVEKVVCNPATVLVSGPRQRLAGIESVRTAPIDLEGRLRSFRVRAGVLSPGGSWQARVSPERATVEVTMTERSASRFFEDMPVRALVQNGQAATVVVRPNRASVELRGQVARLERMTESEIRVFVDCAGLEAGARFDLPVQVHVPSGVSVEKIEPASVNVALGP